MGVSEPMQKSYERNKSNPDLIYLEKLVKLTGISHNELINRPIDIEKFRIPDRPKVTKEANEEIQNTSDNTQYLAGQLSMVERLITKLEKENESIRAEKEDLLKTLNKNQDLLDKAQNAIIEVLKPIKETIVSVKSNSETILADLAGIMNMTRADDLSMMEGTDKILGRESGTTAQEAHIVEHGLGVLAQETDTTPTTRKKNNGGKETQQGKA